MIGIRSVLNRPWACCFCRRSAILSALLLTLLVTLLAVKLWPLNICSGFGVNLQQSHGKGSPGLPALQGLVFVTHHKTGVQT